MRFKYIFAALLAVVIVPAQCMAISVLQPGTKKATMNVAVTITNATGSIATNGSLDFGTVLSQGGATLQTNATTTITVNVTNGTPYTIAMDLGLHGIPGIGGGTGRYVSGPLLPNSQTADTIYYGLYQDTGQTGKWGTSGNSLASGVGTGGAQTLTVFGTLITASGTTHLAGSYSDVVTVTLSY